MGCRLSGERFDRLGRENGSRGAAPWAPSGAVLRDKAGCLIVKPPRRSAKEPVRNAHPNQDPGFPKAVNNQRADHDWGSIATWWQRAPVVSQVALQCSVPSALPQVTLETTIGNRNPALWKYVQPKDSVLEWVRNVVANRLALDGDAWADIFQKFNSGT